MQAETAGLFLASRPFRRWSARLFHFRGAACEQLGIGGHVFVCAFAATLKSYDHMITRRAQTGTKHRDQRDLLAN